MLCEIGNSNSFLLLWIVMSILGLLSMIILSSLLFYPYYYYICHNPDDPISYKRWLLKNNPKFPESTTVKKEIIHMCKGLSVATLCPAFSLVASKYNISNGYCGYNSSAYSLLVQSLIIFFFTDLYEYIYHYMGHYYSKLWSIHKYHHMFYNPTPFAVIADEYIDQFIRTLPMIILPYFFSINMDLLFAIFALLFYGYGVYLHWGYESKYLTAHNSIFNTSYHHYTHHKVSGINTILYTGFFFKLWDNIFNTNKYDCECFLCRKVRSKKEFMELNKPNYRELLTLDFWRK